jgi:hypothetical protein
MESTRLKCYDVAFDFSIVFGTARLTRNTSFQIPEISTAAALSPFATAFGIFLLLYFVVHPVFVYLRDMNGACEPPVHKSLTTYKRLFISNIIVHPTKTNRCRYPNFHRLSGVSSVPAKGLAHGGVRSNILSELHKKHPILRTGPNSPSYGDLRAIKLSSISTNIPESEDYSALHMPSNI